MNTGRTTISCRFIAQSCAVLLLAAPSAAQTPRSHFLPLLPRWSAPLSAPPIARPLIAGDVIVAPLQTGGVAALNVADGSEAWRADVTASQAIDADGERVYIASRDAVHALDLATGREVWRTPAGTLTAPPFVRNGWVIIASSGDVVAIRAADGFELWRKPLGPMDTAPAIDGDVVFVPLVDGRLVALALLTGEPRWEQRLGGAPGEPLAVGGKVYAGGADKLFYAIDADDGDIEWRSHVGAVPRGRPAANDRHVYYMALDNVLRAFDRGNGALKWRSGLRYRPASGPALVGTAILVPGAVASLPVFGYDGAEITQIKFPASLVWVTNATIGPSGYPLVGVVTGDLEHPWTLWLLEGSSDPAPIPLVPLTEAPGATIPIALPS